MLKNIVVLLILKSIMELLEKAVV